MQYSKTGLAQTEHSEGCRLTSYPDVGGWSIGYGHHNGVGPNQTCTQAQAEQWLIEDTQAAAAAVNAMVRVLLTQGEFDALVDFVYNVGVGNFQRSSMLKYLNQNRPDLAAQEFEKWDLASGKVVAGLLQRRREEKAEFVYSPPILAA